MKLESIAFALGGMAFGILLGWVLGAQHAGGARAASGAAAPAAAADRTDQQAPVLDRARVEELMRVVEKEPRNAAVVTELANLYFDAERFDEAVSWYERSLAIDPKNADVSTDLGVSYYYLNRPDEAIKQFDYTLGINPRHVKTWLNKGIVLAFGKEDLKGAADAWQRVVELAPDSREGQAARRALEGIAAAHPGGAGASADP